MGHYFAQEPASISQPQLINITFQGLNLRVRTDNEVFSKNGLDRGTAVLLKAILTAETADKIGSIWDFACGWGAVSLILAAFYPESNFYLSDINSRACSLATANMIMNNVKKFQTVQADAAAAYTGRLFDLIALNPPIRTGKIKVRQMLTAALSRLENGGKFYCVIGKKQGAASYSAFLQDLAEQDNLTYKLLLREQGYEVFCLRKE